MAVTMYLNNAAAPYTPATLRGAWDDTSGQVTKYLATDKTDGGAIANVSKAEATATVDWDVLLFRGVSVGLAVGLTFSGTLNVMLGVDEGAGDADFVYHIHAYVTTGDSDTVRGTLLSDYVETTANEWSTTTGFGLALATAQALTGVVASAGDRIVVEIGYRAKNSTASSRAGRLYYGGDILTTDLGAGGAGATLTGFLTFTDALTFAQTDARVSQVAMEGVLALGAVDLQVGQLSMEGVLALPAVDLQVGQLGIEVVIFNYSPIVAFPYTQIVVAG